MRQRRLPDYSAKARCARHGLYPLNFRYRGASFGNACPQCYPDWQPKWKAVRDAELARHDHPEHGSQEP